MKSRVRWGILGTATIAREAAIDSLRTPPYDQRAELVAIGSRSLERAHAVAAEWNIERAYGSYDELLADPDIDAVYIPLPNHLHVPFSIQSLEAGKHVLCEKPIAPSAADAQRLVDASGRHPRQKLMEAFMYRHHPQWHWARQVVDEGRIGELQTIHSFFSFYDDDPNTILHRADWGGGALLDIGCYSISLSRFLYQDEPLRVLGHLQIDPRFGVDRRTSGILEFSGGTSTFTCATCMAPYQRVHIYGTRGHMELETPFNPPTNQPCRAWIDVEGRIEQIEFAACDQYGIQFDRFSRTILEDAPVDYPIDDALSNMQVLDSIAQSSLKGGWEAL